MDESMDIDIVLDDEDAELAELRAQQDAMSARAKAAEAQYEDEMPGVEDAPEEGEVDSSAPVPNKIHIRGLDTLTTADIREWVKEHHTDEAFKRVEWIDDTSANLIFDDERAAVEALTALSTEQPAGAFDLRAAKGIAARPDTNLQLRQTMAADVKLPGAKDRSRFYLLNPEHDPDTRFPNGRKRRYQDDRGNGVHKKRRGDREMGGRRRNSEDGTPFNVNFYDDDAEVTESSDRAKNVDLFSRTGRGRRSSDNDKRLRQGRLYDRSASPAKDGDGRYGFDDQQPYRRAARRRSRTPPDLAESVLRRGATGGDKDDLFAGRSKSRALRDEIEDHGALLRGNGSKELFPDRAAPHRRTDAQDIDADEVASIRGDDDFEHPRKRDLFARITDGPPRSRSKRRYDETLDRESNGFSIRGASRAENPLVKELFPMKAQNGSKDLFDGRIKGRASQRRRAEDLF